MDSDTALLVFLGVCLIGVVLVGLLIVFTPIMSWLLIGGVVFLGVKFGLTLFGLSGASSDRPRLLSENLVSKSTISMSTGVRPAGPERFAINASGSISNHSDRLITGIKVWCRAEALHGSDTGSGTIPVAVKPGETQSFSGEVANRFYGIAQSGKVLRVAPERHFCRVERLIEG
ncbi:hypothetical protein [Microvirga sp. VF16]|uniref:hypothetical protein n=1 Tax=Microvirga sp. VF16 TaxID=2807101 RepID=UPI00193D5048|nr:hypothetical protein [Microvirga sp. VF16]QRM31088.1 hypothetical protein JO965_08890 [Microvirga sp. VF16]